MSPQFPKASPCPGNRGICIILERWQLTSRAVQALCRDSQPPSAIGSDSGKKLGPLAGSSEYQDPNPGGPTPGNKLSTPRTSGLPCTGKFHPKPPKVPQHPRSHYIWRRIAGKPRAVCPTTNTLLTKATVQQFVEENSVTSVLIVPCKKYCTTHISDFGNYAVPSFSNSKEEGSQESIKVLSKELI